MSLRNESYDGSESRGFTLLEMLVVLVIIGILGLIAMPALLSDRRQNMRSTESKLVSGLRALRAEAILRDETTAIQISADHYTLQPDGLTVALPKALFLDFQPSVGVIPPPDDDVVEFFPDGSSTGGIISVRQNQSVIDVVVRGIDGTTIRHDP